MQSDSDDNDSSDVLCDDHAYCNCNLDGDNDYTTTTNDNRRNNNKESNRRVGRKSKDTNSSQFNESGDAELATKKSHNSSTGSIRESSSDGLTSSGSAIIESFSQNNQA